jgi:hypothetical protein
MLYNLADRELLEPFLPFHLEYAFSSALLLSLLETVAPTYIGERRWLDTAFSILDRMIRRGNMVALLRKNELEHLEQHLVVVRHTDTFHFSPVEAPHFASQQPTPSRNNNAAAPTLPEVSQESSLSMDAHWDSLFGHEGMMTNHEQILELAEQFDGEPLDPALLFDF